MCEEEQQGNKLYCKEGDMKGSKTSTTTNYCCMSIVYATLLVLKIETCKLGFILNFHMQCKIFLDVCCELRDSAGNLETEHTSKDDDIILVLVGLTCNLIAVSCICCF
jgi:hypothetical protein